MKSLNVLEEFLKNEEEVESIRDVVSALNSFNEVRKACFGQTLDPDYKCFISRFADAYIKLEVDITPNVHGVLVHVPEFLDKNPGHGLGLWSEQASESVH